MTRTTGIAVLALTALLEAGGDAIIRAGMGSPSPVRL